MADEQQPTDKNQVLQETEPRADAEQLAHLYKMSTTSAGGGTEYVAINGVSIAALLLGIASVLALIHDVFLIIPVAGAICGIIALVQIRRSSGTQTGLVFAIIGLALAILLSGGRMAVSVIDMRQTLADTRKLVPLIDELGKSIHYGRYDEAYEDLFTQAFRARVDRVTFKNVLEQNGRDMGPLDYLKWNEEGITFREIGTSGVKEAFGMALMKNQRMSAPTRPVITFTNRDGPWKIDAFDPFFPEAKAKKGELTPQ